MCSLTTHLGLSQHRSRYSARPLCVDDVKVFQFQDVAAIWRQSDPGPGQRWLAAPCRLYERHSVGLRIRLECPYPIRTQVIVKHTLKTGVLHPLIEHRHSKVREKRHPQTFNPFSAAESLSLCYPSSENPGLGHPHRRRTRFDQAVTATIAPQPHTSQTKPRRVFFGQARQWVPTTAPWAAKIREPGLAPSPPRGRKRISTRRW